MKAHIGDRLVLNGIHVGDARRVGVVTGLRHADGTPPYVVRWLDNGRVGLVFPGSEAHVEPATGSGPEGVAGHERAPEHERP